MNSKTKRCPQCGVTNKMTKMTTWEDDRRVKMIGDRLFEMWEAVCAGCGAYYRTGSRYLGMKKPKEEPKPNESNDPTWEHLTEAYIRSNSSSIRALSKRLTRLETQKEPTPGPKKEPTVTMSLKSWDNLDRDLSQTEHHLISVLTNIRLIRGRMYKSMKQCLEGRLDENLARVAELKESVEDLRKVADEIKAEKEKEKKPNDGEEETTD